MVTTHDHRLVPVADKVTELVPDLGLTDLPPAEERPAAGEILFRQGSWGERIYVVEEGSIKILAERSCGGDEVLTVVTPGNLPR